GAQFVDYNASAWSFITEGYLQPTLEFGFEQGTQTVAAGKVGFDDFAIKPDNLTDGLIAYYPFNGNANDESGNDRHGTPTGTATLAADRYGSANRAYDFDGSGKIGLPAFNYGSQFTISAWINFDADNRTHLIITKKPADAIDSVALTFQDGKFKAVVFSSNNVFIGRSAQNTTPSVGVWSHLTFTFDGGTAPSAIKIYKDGVRIDDGDLSLGSFTTFNDLNVASEIGSQNSGAGAADGKFDDFRIYNRALGSAEVTQLYNLEAPPPNNSPPAIVTHPASVTVDADGNATFSVDANGTNLAYQWQRRDGQGNWINILDANGSTLTLQDEGSIGSLKGRNDFWMGKLDDMRVYNRDLNASEIAGLIGSTQ
ncbi:uncharacterized protein METZ01_LOCUS313260, partial [marine metagenome]